MVIFSFICSLLFCLTLVTFVISLIIAILRERKNLVKMNSELNKLTNLMNTIPNNNNLGDSYDKDKEE